MHYVICYDLENDRLRGKAVKLLERHGCSRVQKSVFAAPELEKKTWFGCNWHCINVLPVIPYRPATACTSYRCGKKMRRIYRFSEKTIYTRNWKKNR